MDPERARRAEERKLRKEREQAAKLIGQAPKEDEKRIPIDIIYRKLVALKTAVKDGTLVEDLWVEDGSRYVRIPIGASVTLHPAGSPTEIIVAGTEKTIQDKLCKKEQGRVFAQSGAWIHSDGAKREAERKKQSEETAAAFCAQAGDGSLAELPEWSCEPYFELRSWSGTLWPHCLLCNKFADYDHVLSEKHLKRVPYWLDYLPQEHKARIFERPNAPAPAQPPIPTMPAPQLVPAPPSMPPPPLVPALPSMSAPPLMPAPPSMSAAPTIPTMPEARTMPVPPSMYAAPSMHLASSMPVAPSMSAAPSMPAMPAAPTTSTIPLDPAMPKMPAATTMQGNPSPTFLARPSAQGSTVAPMLCTPSVAAPSAYPTSFEPQYEAQKASPQQPASTPPQSDKEKNWVRVERYDATERRSTQEEREGSNGDWHQRGWTQSEWNDWRKDEYARFTHDTGSRTNGWIDWAGKADWNSSTAWGNDATNWADWSARNNSWWRTGAKETKERHTWTSWRNDCNRQGWSETA